MKTKPKINVLLIDDDKILGAQLVRELNERGYETRYFPSVERITENIRSLQPDVLVLDVMLGKQNGIEMGRNLYEIFPTLPIIFISSYHEEPLKEKGLHAGGVAYLDKPLSVRLLAAHIDRFARQRDGRYKEDDGAPERIGNMLLDNRNRAIITEDGIIKELRPMDYVLLKKLTANLDRVVSREELFYAAWEGNTESYNENSLNNYIRRLRVLLAENTNLKITLQKGNGYKLSIHLLS
ncbi:response regulator transcription factor [Limibacterium fermenti]|uniref:response regulator transcription factor n=1 Tax=Limibacterium fermenti TaxID=3229863 RepID=UPI000E7DE645|nr:hypothetical protein [Porphyromonadaceae bacterium]